MMHAIFDIWTNSIINEKTSVKDSVVWYSNINLNRIGRYNMVQIWKVKQYHMAPSLSVVFKLNRTVETEWSLRHLIDCLNLDIFCGWFSKYSARSIMETPQNLDVA